MDTAGIRRRAKVTENVEYFSVVRSRSAIEEADLVVVLLDAGEILTDQDKKIVNMVFEAHKNMIIFVNKWDLTERSDSVRTELKNTCENAFFLLRYYPFIFGSALKRVGLGKLFSTIPEVINRSEQRISTGELNRFIEEVIKKNPPPAKKGKRVKIYYATQVAVSPPTFVLFINHPDLLDTDYKRFVEKRIRLFFDRFDGVTIKLKFKGHRQSAP